MGRYYIYIYQKKLSEDINYICVFGILNKTDIGSLVLILRALTV